MARTGAFCPKCLRSSRAVAGSSCPKCQVARLALFDAQGALSRAFLQARGTCCRGGCVNCPYGFVLPEERVGHAQTIALSGGL